MGLVREKKKIHKRVTGFHIGFYYNDEGWDEAAEGEGKGNEERGKGMRKGETKQTK